MTVSQETVSTLVLWVFRACLPPALVWSVSLSMTMCGVLFTHVFLIVTVPDNYEASFTADVYFATVENSVRNLTTAFEFTAVLDNAHFGTLSSISFSIVGTVEAQGIFRLSNNLLSKPYVAGVDPEVSVDDSMNTTIIRDSVIIFNNPTQPIQADLYHFTLGALLIGLRGGLVVSQPEITGLVEVTQSAGM